MIVRRFFEPLLAQASYLIGCTSSGKAIVIDPHRDADVYMRAAAQDNLTIAYVTETHIHADFLSGTRELATRSGATMLLSGEGGDDWQYAFANACRLSCVTAIESTWATSRSTSSTHRATPRST